MESVLQHIQENYTKPICHSDLAEMSGYRSWHFCRKFRKETGVTVTTYLTAFRVEHAKKLLEDSPCDVQEVATLSGFQSAVQFHRMFKRLTGQTPMRYRVSSYGGTKP